MKDVLIRKGEAVQIDSEASTVTDDFPRKAIRVGCMDDTREG
jgi:hypothetical protein